MFTEQIQTVLIPGPEFHKLAWQLHGIPSHAMRTCHRDIVHFSQHVMQAVTKFMEQGNYFIMREQCRSVANRWSKVTHHIADQIGRASCRERRRIEIERVAIEKIR